MATSSADAGWLQVTTDAVAVAEARRLALASTNSRVRRLMQQPEKLGYDDIDRLVQANASVLLPAWRALAASADEPFERRVTAAEFLCNRRDGGGLAFLLDTLRTAAKPRRREALRVLYHAVCKNAPWVRRHAPELPNALLKLFNRVHDDCIPMLARMCKDLEVAGAADKALALWQEPISPWARHALVTDLMPVEAKTADRLAAVETVLRARKLSEFDLSEGLQCATAFLDSPHLEVVECSLDLIGKRFPWSNKELRDDDAGASSEWYPIIEEMGKRGGRAAVPLLERFLHSKLNVGYRGFALQALANVLGPDALPYVDELIHERRLAFVIACALGTAFQGTGDTRAIGRLQELASRTRDDYARQHIATALAAVAGRGARKTARKRPAGSKAHDTLANQTTLTQVCSRLAAIGLIAPLAPEEIQAMQATEKKKDDDPAWSLIVLAYGHIRTSFDTEGSEAPPRHDELIREFAENSRDLFAPEAVLQRQGNGRRAETVIQFVWRDRLYRFPVRDFSDYYDLDRMVGAMNTALADAGLAERFLALDTGDQIADFIFGDLALIAAAAREFHWTLDHDFNTAIAKQSHR